MHLQAGYLDGVSKSGNPLERVLDRLVNVPPELQRKLSTIKDLEERLQHLRVQAENRARTLQALPSEASTSTSPEEIAHVQTEREALEDMHNLIAHISSEKVRLAGEASELAASCLLRLGDDYEAYEAEVDAKEGARATNSARTNPLHGVSLETNSASIQPRTPNEYALKEWAERIKYMRPGDQLAANTSQSASTSANEEQWILAVYQDWNSEQDLFEVRDYDEEDPSAEPFRLRMRDVVPLPKLNLGAEPPIYQRDTNVLAVYPGTTVFYKARVVKEAQRLGNDQYSSYQLEFEEDSGSTQRVEIKYVVQPPTALLPAC